MCCNDKQRTRDAHVRAYRAKISAKRCAGERRRRRSLAQRLAQGLAQRWRRLRRRHGLSRQDYEALLAKQGGACAICRQSPREPLVVDRARVDGRVRGLLCRRCKAAITCFNEDPRLLRQASAYQKSTLPDGEP
jgi:Recombination endonuclease VII